MIQIKQLQFIPSLDYTKYAETELLLGAVFLRDIERRSEGIWVVMIDEEPAMVVGVIRYSLVNPPRLWVIVCSSFTNNRVSYKLRMLKYVMQEAALRYANLETLVESGWETGERFARFAGFRQTKNSVFLMDKTYTVWEL